ncbi:MAG: C-terminal target protein [Bacteroidota bacterium]|jgi:hypothetical protein|nr:C-terminal target protein [Bacteroidota bacterium]
MKKLYLVLSIILIVFSARGQLTLTKVFNEPVLGDVNTKQLYDSVGVIPKGAGTNQVWDFSGFSLKSNVEVSNYIAASSAPNGSSYSGTSFVESFGQTYFYMKASATKYEIVGIQNPSFKLNFSANNATEFVWPVSMGYSMSDVFSGTANANNMNGSVSGNITTIAPGSGTLILPGGDTVSGVLQVKISLSAVASFIFGTIKANLKAVDYTYYDAFNKFPLLTVSYLTSSGAYTANSVAIKVNSSLVGIQNLSSDFSNNIFPNPATDNFHIELKNPTNASCKLEIIDVLGDVVLTASLGTDREISRTITISDLSKGMYVIRMQAGDKISSRKLIKE